MGAPYLPNLYGEINNGAHKKAADQIGAPALIWHQALWKPAHDDASREQRAADIKKYLQELYLYIVRRKYTIDLHYDEIDVGPNDRVRVITFPIIWNALRVRIRFEVHTEYFTITSIIDLSVDTQKRIRNRNFPSNKIRQKLVGKFEQLLDLLSKPPLDPELDATLYCQNAPKFRALHRELYRTFWEGTFDRFLNVRSKSSPKGWLNSGNLGMRFGDFRGVITCDSYPERNTRDGDLADFLPEDHPLKGIHYRNNENLRGQWHRVGIPSEKWVRRRLNAAWPFLEAQAKPLPGRTEYTASRLLDGRMLYVTALGPQPNEAAPPGEEQPVYFYLHSTTQCERQIGRAIDRMCNLGTLRLAAIIALLALKMAGVKLREVEKQLQGSRDLIHNLIKQCSRAVYGPPVPSRIRLATESEIIQSFDKIQQHMSNMADGDENDNKLLGNESLDYRLSRSRYYHEQFEKRVKDLRIVNIEGYQKYDEFVNRRLDGAFGFINEIERRSVSIRADWRAVDQLYLATSVTMLTGEIEEQQIISSSQQKIAVDTQRQIERMQKFAEFALFLVLLPYYLGSIAVHSWFPVELVRFGLEKFRPFYFIGQDMREEEFVSRALWVFSFLVGATFLIVKNRLEKSDEKRL